jgi:hypothetical protein
MECQLLLVLLIQFWSIVFTQYHYHINSQNFLCNSTIIDTLRWTIADVLELPVDEVHVGCGNIN